MLRRAIHTTFNCSITVPSLIRHCLTVDIAIQMPTVNVQSVSADLLFSKPSHSIFYELVPELTIISYLFMTCSDVIS